MTQGWVASTLPLTREEFVAGERVRRYHYCVATSAPRPRHRSICGQLTLAGQHKVLPTWPSGKVCRRCAALYRARVRSVIGDPSRELALAREEGRSG